MEHKYLYVVLGGLVLFTIFVLFKIIVHCRPVKPKLYFFETGNNPMVEIAKHLNFLHEPYVPPLLWGRNGHIQTAIYGTLGHARLLRSYDRRHVVKLADGLTTSTFDVFEPIGENTVGDFTVAVCPGIANSSESNYIRTLVHHAQEAGYRCAVLNHLGAIRNIKLTSSRIFYYGQTEEYETMLSTLLEFYPKTKIIALGFSMGANIITLYLGRNHDPLKIPIVCGISVCQGYDACKTIEMLENWTNFRRFYMYILTANVQRLLRFHYDKTISPFVSSGLINERNVWNSTSLYMLDENYTRRVLGFKTVEEYWHWSSSLPVITQIKVPMFFVNSMDDPLMPYPLLVPVIKICENNKNFMFILTKHGGHLGYLQGTTFSPKSVTWIDQLVVQLSNAMINKVKL